jgi:hypothetical protein
MKAIIQLNLGIGKKVMFLNIESISEVQLVQSLLYQAIKGVYISMNNFEWRGFIVYIVHNS